MKIDYYVLVRRNKNTKNKWQKYGMDGWGTMSVLYCYVFEGIFDATKGLHKCMNYYKENNKYSYAIKNTETSKIIKAEDIWNSSESVFAS